MGTLYERLLLLCEERGIKGGRMCVDLGISKSLMTDLKSGRKKSINAETAQKIASYFGVSVGYLLGEEEQKKSTIPEDDGLSESQKALIDFARSASPEKAAKVLRLMQVALEDD